MELIFAPDADSKAAIDFIPVQELYLNLFQV